MGLYQEQLLPRLLNVAMNTVELREIRARVCRPLAGDVVEIGFGTGLNLPYLPSAVRTLRVVEPSVVGVRLAAGRRAASDVAVQVAGPDGQRLPFENGSADAVLCTWTLCTVPDPVAAVREMKRVLRADGRLHFVEHGLAPDPAVRVWQRRLNGLQHAVAGGCHLDRDIPALLAAGGLTIQRLDAYYGAGSPRPYAAMYEGIAGPSESR